MISLRERVAQARVTSMIGIVIGTLFSAFNLLTPGMLALGAAELSGVIFFILPAAYLSRTEKHVALAETLLLLATGIIFGSLVVFGGIGGTGIYWVFTAPFVAFFLKGQKAAWIFSAGLWLLTGMYLHWIAPHYSFAYHYDALQSLHAWFALGFYTVVAAAFAHIRTRYADKLQRAKERAEGDVVAKSHFLASASHDLRQPAHALGMFVGRLSQLPLSGESRELVQGVEASVRALQHMLDEFFDYSRLGLPSMTVSKSDFAVEQVLAPLRSSFASQAQAKGLRLRVRQSAAWVHADTAILQRILVNLVANALQYTEKGGVLVACRSVDQGRQLRIEVWDTGLGIAKELQERVFSEFFQVGNPERNRAKGFGLGLSIVKLACQRCEYPLALRSELGRGSCFSVTVPVVPAPSATLGVAPRDTEFESGTDRWGLVNTLQGRKVLVIEDDPLGGAANHSLLTGWGCVVQVQASAAEALHCVQSGFVPDVIVSDYRLPGGKNGLDAVQMLWHALGQHVPACMVSGDTDPELRAQASALGMPLLRKPVQPAKLRAALRNLLAQQA